MFLKNLSKDQLENRLNAFDNDGEQLDIYFEDKLPQKFQENKIQTKKIVSIRNICIVLTIIEIFSALSGIFFYFIRRVNHFLNKK